MRSARLMPWQNLATKEDLRRLEEKMATKKELKRVETSLREDLRGVEKSLREDLRRVELALDALGARWGVFSEDAFRGGVRELLRDAGTAWITHDLNIPLTTSSTTLRISRVLPGWVPLNHDVRRRALGQNNITSNRYI